jgi:hypothetical protein
MSAKKMFGQYEQISGMWESELETYSDEQFKKKPSSEGWSIGQVYAHLVMGSFNYHIKQIEQCLESEANQHEKKTFPGRLMFFIHAFPPVRIKVPPSPAYTPQQPERKEKILAGMRLLRKKLQELSREVDAASHVGKTKHPALGYLDAREWYQLIVMHFRHHRRQKRRLDVFLKGM